MDYVTAERVKIPMMPKGVEHHMMTMQRPQIMKVKIPMPPRGVQHS